MPPLIGLLLPGSLSPQKFTVNPHLCQRLPNTYRQLWLSLLWGHCLFLLGPGVHKILLVPSKSLFQVWGLILTWFHPSYCLSAASTLSLDVGCLFGRFQNDSINDCSAANCGLGVLSGEDECVSFYFTILDQAYTYVHIHIHTCTHVCMLYVNLMVTSNQKSVIDKHKGRERNSNIILKIAIQSQVKRAKEERNKIKL